MAKTSKPTPPAKVDKSKLLQIVSRPGVSEDRLLADVATDGLASSAIVAVGFLQTSQPGLSLTDMVNSLRDHGQRVNRNDFAAAEQMLTGQAVALNAIFAELSRRAALNMGEYMDATERYMRLALKAQGQCRATVETLAAIKNPPVVFAKQANITSGPQQVNNGILSGPKGDQTPAAPAHEETGNQQTKLLEGTQHGSTVLDAGTTATATGGHPDLEAVGAIHRAEKPGGQG